MNTLATNRNHLVAARFLALAADARRAALENCITLIERGGDIPVYWRADAAAARHYADQARAFMTRAIAARNGIAGRRT